MYRAIFSLSQLHADQQLPLFTIILGIVPASVTNSLLTRISHVGAR